MRWGRGDLYLKYVGKPPPPAPTMPAWRMISTASSTLKALTSSRLRCFISATTHRPRSVVLRVDLDARRGRRVVELGGPGHVVLHVFRNLVAGVDGLYRA